jgi:hypothetical protein
MAYVSQNYATSPNAPAGQWTCSPTSSLGPFKKAPTGQQTKGTDLCGQCVSYVKKVCPTLPPTGVWTKGAPVKDNQSILAGTVIATFNSAGKYEGHAAIYVSQNKTGIVVYDQYVTPPNPSPVGSRTLRWNAHGNSNNGNNFFVVD